MKTLLQALTVVLPTCWLVCTILHGMAFGGPRAPEVERPRRLALRLTLLAHASLFVVRWQASDQFPISDTWSTVSAVALGVALLYAWIARTLAHPGTGGVVLGVVFLLQLVASAVGPLEPPSRLTGAGLLPILHVLTSVIAASALVTSGLHGFLYLLVYRRMRQRSFGPLLANLPDMTLLARMTRRSAFAGFVFSTIGLNVGIGIAHAKGVEGFGYLDPQVLLTLALWIHFGVIAFSERIRGFTARRASWAAAAGLAVVIVSLLLTLFPAFTFHAAS